jgi:NhaP-type Na+/H+ or K+/H+ antiporter
MPNLDVAPQAANVQGWGAFLHWQLILEIVSVLLLATALAAVIAYHPRTYGKAKTLEEVDQPKVFIMYAVVGAVIAESVQVSPIMGMVIFGIGGLLRFRTDVGAARDTGRVILVTIIGLACGLKIYVAAVIATAFSWLLIYVLES